MKRPDVIEGTYVSGRRTLEYWTSCEHCKERKECRHTCDHPGWIRLLVDGNKSVQWQGIITLKKITRTVRDYLINDPPEDVNYPPVGWQQTEMEMELCPATPHQPTPTIN